MLQHAGTFNNNVLTMAAGAAGLGEVYTPQVAEAHNARGDRLRESLAAAARSRGAPVHLSGLGSMIGVHFAREPVTRPEQAAEEHPQAKALFHLDMIGRGQVTGKIGMLATSIPLTEDDYDGFVAAFEAFLDEHGAVLPGA